MSYLGWGLLLDESDLGQQRFLLSVLDVENTPLFMRTRVSVWYLDWSRSMWDLRRGDNVLPLGSCPQSMPRYTMLGLLSTTVDASGRTFVYGSSSSFRRSIIVYIDRTLHPAPVVKVG